MPAPRLSDAQRVELMIPARMFWRLAYQLGAEVVFRSAPASRDKIAARLAEEGARVTEAAIDAAVAKHEAEREEWTVDGEGVAKIAAMLDGFTAAWTEAVADLPPKKAASLYRRAARAAAHAMDRLEGGSLPKAIYATNLLLADLIADGTLEPIAEGSSFDRAHSLFASACTEDQRNVELLDQVERSAEKASRKMRDDLIAQGFYAPPAKAA